MNSLRKASFFCSARYKMRVMRVMRANNQKRI